MARSREEWDGLSLPSLGGDIPLPGGEDQDKGGLCSPKGRHAAEVAPEAPERAVGAGAEVMKRERMLRLALFRNLQRVPRGGQGSGCSNLTAQPTPETGEAQKQKIKVLVGC